MLAAIFIIGSGVLCGMYVLYKTITGEPRHYLVSGSALPLFFGSAGALLMIYLEYPRETVNPVLIGSFVSFGILLPIGYLVLYLKSSPSERADVRARLLRGFGILLGTMGAILAIILVGQLLGGGGVS